METFGQPLVARSGDRPQRGFVRASYALVGGQAVALWVATIDPAAVRTTKDVDLLLDRFDLPAARVAARSVELDYFETMGVGMWLRHDAKAISLSPIPHWIQ